MRFINARSAVLFCMLLSITASGGTTSLKERKARNEFMIGTTSIPATLDPTLAWHVLHFVALRCVYQSLVKVGETGRIISDLARRWEVSEDGRVYTMYLDASAKFSNGLPVTASDAAFSLSAHFWPGSKSAVAGYLRDVIEGAESVKANQILSGITTPSPNILKIHLAQPYAPFFQVLSMQGYSVFQREAFLRHDLVGSGPMIAELDSRKGKWTFLRRTDLGLDKKGPKKISLERLADNEEAIRKMQAHEVDLTMGFEGYAWDRVHSISDFNEKRIESLGFEHLFMNSTHPLLQRSGLRRDLVALIRTFTAQSNELGFFLEDSDTYLPRGVMQPEYYQVKNETLSAAQFKKRWGVLVRKNKFKIAVKESGASPKLIHDLVDILNQAGFESNLVIEPVEKLVERIKRQEYDLVLIGYVGAVNDPDGFIEPLRESNVLHYGVMPTSKFFGEILKVKFIKNPLERLRKYGEALRTLEDQHYFVPMFRMYIPLLVHKDLVIPESHFRYTFDMTQLHWNESP